MLAELRQVEMKLKKHIDTVNWPSSSQMLTFLSSKKWQAKATLSWYDIPSSFCKVQEHYIIYSK